MTASGSLPTSFYAIYTRLSFANEKDFGLTDSQHNIYHLATARLLNLVQ
jgi:hypothetical protein